MKMHFFLQLTLIEEDLRLKLELQTVKHQFSGLLDNFRSFDRILQAPQLIAHGQSRQGTNQRVDDARCRVRALYAAKRSRLMKQRREAEEEERLAYNYAHYSRTPQRHPRKHSPYQRTPQRHAPYQHTPHRNHYDTSVWSEESMLLQDAQEPQHHRHHHHQPHRRSNKRRSLHHQHQPDSSPLNTVDINDISCISGKRHIREHTSSANLSGDVLHSTLNYPLHSTLNYPLHSTVVEGDSLGSPVSSGSPSRDDHCGQPSFTGKRRLFREESFHVDGRITDCVIEEYEGELVDGVDEDEGDFEVDVDATLPSSPSPGQLVPGNNRDHDVQQMSCQQRCLKRQTAQARLQADVAYYRQQLQCGGDTDVSCLAEHEATYRAQDDACSAAYRFPGTESGCQANGGGSTPTVCHSMPDLTFASTGAVDPCSRIALRSHTSASFYNNSKDHSNENNKDKDTTTTANNKSSSTNASSLQQRQVPRNSPNTDQSNGSSNGKPPHQPVSATSSTHPVVSYTRYTRSGRSSACKRPLDGQLPLDPGFSNEAPYKLQKSTSVRIHDRAMRKSLKRKMRRFNEDLQLSADHSHAYDVLVYL